MTALGRGDRDALLEALARFTRVDPDPFVAGPIVLPDATFFPDAWSPTEAGLDALAQRLLGYAGLGTLTADVTLDERALDEAALLPKTEVDLAGVEGDTAFFTVTHLGQPDDAALAFAHEVARAALLVRDAAAESYREAPRAGILAPDEAADDRFEASVLGVHLGLGVLGACGAHSFRQVGRLEGQQTVTAHAHVVYGGLAPEAASYLLAVQLCVREVEGAEREAVLTALSTERRGEVLAELPALDRTALLAALGLPPPERWPAVRAPADSTESHARRKKKKARSRGKKAPGAIGFRVTRHRLAAGACIGTALGVGGAMLAGPILGAGALAFPTLILGTGAGLLLGWHRKSWDCSACERDVPLDGDVCAACGAHLVGEIAHRAQRLDAEDEWHREQRRRRRERRASEEPEG